MKRFSLQMFVSVAGALLTILFFSIMIRQEQKRIDRMMTEEAGKQFALLEKEIAANLEALDWVKSFFDASESVSRKEFAVFTKPLLKKYTNAQAVEWIPRISFVEKKEYEARAQKEGVTGFVITEKEKGQMKTAGRRAVYYPVYFVEPVMTNQAAMGFDLGSDPRRLQALQQAMETGAKVATAKITLVQETENQSGILILNPVYEGAGFYASTVLRKERLRGFVLVVLRVGDMVANALGGKLASFDVKILDVSDADHIEEIYLHKSKVTEKPHTDLQRFLRIGGRTWQVHISPHVTAYEKYAFLVPWIVLGSGMIITTLVSVLFAQQSRRRIEIEKVVAEKTQALKESTERYDVAVRGSNSGLWDWNVLTNELYWSPRFKEIIGITDKDFLPHFREFEDRLHKEDYGFVMEALTGHLNGGTSYDVEYRLKRNDGVYVWIHARGQAIWDGEGNPTRMAGSVDDISEKKAAEAALRESQKRLALVIEGTRDGIWDWMDMDSDAEYWSPQWKKLLGYEDDEIEGSAAAFFAMVHPEDVARTRQCLEDHMQYGTPFDLEYRLRTKEGIYKWFQGKGLVTVTEATGKKRMTGSITDIDARKQAEKRLEENLIFQELIKESNPDLVFVKDESFVIVDANQVFLNLYPEKDMWEVIGSTTIESYDEKEAEAFLAMDKKAFQDGFSECIEKIHFPDGSLRTLNTKKTRFQHPDGKRFILGIGRDVTERETLIEKLSHSNQELERFAYVCSHDLQEPLRMIRSFSEKLQTHFGPALDADPKGKKYFHFIIDGAERAQDLIADILEYSRVNKSTLRFEKISMEAMLSHLQACCIEVPNPDLTHEDLPEIYGNKTQIHQLFQNLINNALKYRKKDVAPKIHIGVCDQGNFWQFSIQDNGIGIEKRYHKKIFDVFQRLHGKKMYPGTGIGLSICQKIVESHGGKIWVESEIGNGATFYFTLLKSKKNEGENDNSGATCGNPSC